MSVGRICQRDVDFADPNETILQAATRMRDRSVGALLVLDKLRQPVGILTDRDVVLRVIATGRDPADTTVDEVMTREPTTIGEDAPIELAVSQMRFGAFRRLPVVDPQGELIGLVALDDVLMLLCEEFGSIGGLLAREKPAPAALP